jgi:hypothetical protein
VFWGGRRCCQLPLAPRRSAPHSPRPALPHPNLPPPSDAFVQLCRALASSGRAGTAAALVGRAVAIAKEAARWGACGVEGWGRRERVSPRQAPQLQRAPAHTLCPPLPSGCSRHRQNPTPPPPIRSNKVAKKDQAALARALGASGGARGRRPQLWQLAAEVEVGRAAGGRGGVEGVGRVAQRRR